MPPSPSPPAAIALPALFVVLWSTGFIFARLGLPYAPPFTFLAVRLAISASILLVLALWTGAPWPKTLSDGGHIAVAGLLLNGTYLIGVFEAIERGVSTGVVALIAGLQPILTAAVVGPFLGERVSRRQWAGLVLGFAGIGLVVHERLGAGAGSGEGFALAFVCLVGITAGTLYQKRFCGGADLRTGTAIQFAASALALTAGALVFESREIVWSGQFVAALSWLVLVLSVGTFNLLVVLIRRGAAARVTSLFYLVPPLTAVLGWAIYGETLGPDALAGMAVAVVGVALVNR
jgi:drug/metabolite transporter (DMT)-like permease